MLENRAMRLQLGDAVEVMKELPADSVDLVYLDPPFYTDTNKGDFDDRWRSMDEYTRWLDRGLDQIVGVLRPGGNFVLHLDWHAVHYAKLRCDVHFGLDCFVNEIIWNYASGGASTKRLSRKHDNLLWYVKGGEKENYTFNTMREPYATPDVQDRPGFHPEGRVLTDVWNISIMSTTSKERTGYATQKPLALMERIVRLFSNEGDMVLDPMCGSGTTGVAALRNGRCAYMIDKNPEALAIARPRLMQAAFEWGSQ